MWRPEGGGSLEEPEVKGGGGVEVAGTRLRKQTDPWMQDPLIWISASLLVQGSEDLMWIDCIRWCNVRMEQERWTESSSLNLDIAFDLQLR